MVNHLNEVPDRRAGEWCVNPAGADRKRDATGRVSGYLSAAGQQGEVIDLGCPRGTTNDHGYYAFPSVVCGLPRGFCLSKEEVFGPLLTLETFTDVYDAIALANNTTAYGLSASIWTNRSDRGYRLARSIQAGGVTMSRHRPPPSRRGHPWQQQVFRAASSRDTAWTAACRSSWPIRRRNRCGS